MTYPLGKCLIYTHTFAYLYCLLDLVIKTPITSVAFPFSRRRIGKSALDHLEESVPFGHPWYKLSVTKKTGDY